MESYRNPWIDPVLKVLCTGWFLLHNRITHIGNGHVSLSLTGCVKPRVWQVLTVGLAKVSTLWEIGMCLSSSVKGMLGIWPFLDREFSHGVPDKEHYLGDLEIPLLLGCLHAYLSAVFHIQNGIKEALSGNHSQGSSPDVMCTCFWRAEVKQCDTHDSFWIDQFSSSLFKGGSESFAPLFPTRQPQVLSNSSTHHFSQCYMEWQPFRLHRKEVSHRAKGICTWQDRERKFHMQILFTVWEEDRGRTTRLCILWETSCGRMVHRLP